MEALAVQADVTKQQQKFRNAGNLLSLASHTNASDKTHLLVPQPWYKLHELFPVISVQYHHL